MMNCEEYRDLIASNPSSTDGESHVKACADCRAFAEEMRSLDARILRALEITVPALEVPSLPEVDASNVSQLPRRRVTTPAWFAVAATVVIAATLGFRMLGNDLNYPSLAEEIVAHLEHEPYALRVTNKAVGKERLARVVPATVATMDSNIGLVTYAQSCIINGKQVPHLVIQGDRGPVTILLMPGERVDARQIISGKSINGVILPVGDSSIAIVGEEGENLKQLETSVTNSVTWGT